MRGDKRDKRVNSDGEREERTESEKKGRSNKQTDSV
jgi:hypothetical protein